MRKILILVSLAFFTMQCESPPPTPVVDVEYLYDWMERVDRSLRLQPSEPVTQWEYYFVRGEADRNNFDFLGQNGWELTTHSSVLIHDGRGGTIEKSYYTFKRPLR